VGARSWRERARERGRSGERAVRSGAGAGRRQRGAVARHGRDAGAGGAQRGKAGGAEQTQAVGCADAEPVGWHRRRVGAALEQGRGRWWHGSYWVQRGS
jgi:hypothetical protein